MYARLETAESTARPSDHYKVRDERIGAGIERYLICAFLLGISRSALDAGASAPPVLVSTDNTVLWRRLARFRGRAPRQSIDQNDESHECNHSERDPPAPQAGDDREDPNGESEHHPMYLRYLKLFVSSDITPDTDYLDSLRGDGHQASRMGANAISEKSTKLDVWTRLERGEQLAQDGWATLRCGRA